MDYSEQIYPSNKAEHLNQSCFCITLNREALCEAINDEAGDPGFCNAHVRPRSNLFSNVPVFLTNQSLTEMQAVVEAITR